MKVLITGHSDGLGFALMQYYLSHGAKVYGLSRRQVSFQGAQIAQVSCDLRKNEQIESSLSVLLGGAVPDLVFLNAGVLGPVKAMQDTALADIEAVMQVNVWCNKSILDYFLKLDMSPSQIVLISSGASIKGGYGWSAYALSKSTLNMLARLYAHEFKHTHVTALAPGIVDTPMQAKICDDRYVNINKFVDFRRLRQAKAQGIMPQAAAAAANIACNMDKLRQFDSGSYVDLRDIIA